MILYIHTALKNPRRIGQVTILYDRIISFKFLLPIRYEYPYKIIAEQEAFKSGIPLETHETVQNECSYKFTIKPLSKADEGYRSNYRLTHELLSNELKSYVGGYTFLIRLNWWQKTVLTYNLRKFVWQTKEFKKHIYYYIGTSIIGAILGILGAIHFIKPCEQNTVQESRNNTKQLSEMKETRNQDSNKNTSSLKDSTILLNQKK